MKTASRASFPTENTAFPALHPLRLAQSGEHAVLEGEQRPGHARRDEHRPRHGGAEGAYDAPQASSVSRKTAAASATTSELAAYVPPTRRPVSRPARGTKRTTAPIIVVAVMLASSRIAAIAAEPWPTASSE